MQGKPVDAGKPDIDNTMTYLEAGPHRRPNETGPGSPSDREAHDEVHQGRGGWCTPEAPMGVQGKPVHAGGPTSTIQ